MKKLKIVLQSKYLYIFLIIITFFYVIYKNVSKIPSKYVGTETEIIGIINDFNIDGNKLTIELIEKEKIIVNYYIKTELELNEIKKNYKLGQKLLVLGTLKIPSKNSVFNLFNYQNYLKSKKIYWIFDANNITKLDYKISLKYKLKNLFINHISSFKNVSAYLKTFVLGDTDQIANEALNSYRTNGISHLFAISGMHIALFSSILLKILDKIFKTKSLSYLITIIFLLIYMFLTNYSPSVLRATIFFILCTLNKFFDLKIKNIYLLIIILIFLLIYNPFYIYNLGFLFSFTVTLYLIIFNDIINRHKTYFGKIFATSLIAFLASLPIQINSFFNINLLSIFLNVFFVSFVSIIIFPLSLLTFVCPLINNLLYICIIVLEKISLFFSNINIFNITLCHINTYIFILYYILITVVLYKIKNKKNKFLIIIIIILIIHNNILKFQKYPIITMLDVGQGDAIVIILPHNHGNILIDTGGIIKYEQEWQKKKNEYSLAKNKIIPYLKSMGVKSLDYLILTHGDFDHMGEAINLVNNFKVEKVIFNWGQFNELEQELIQALNNREIPYYSRIKELNIDSNKLYFLNNKDYGNENDNSSVVYTELNTYKFLFMGDSGIQVEEDLIEKYNLNDIDVLKVGHHGSRTSSSIEFIYEINPKYSIISVGKNNRYGHPNDEVLKNLKNTKIYRTDINGSIKFNIQKKDLKIETCEP